MTQTYDSSFPMDRNYRWFCAFLKGSDLNDVDMRFGCGDLIMTLRTSIPRHTSPRTVEGPGKKDNQVTELEINAQAAMFKSWGYRKRYVEFNQAYSRCMKCPKLQCSSLRERILSNVRQNLAQAAARKCNIKFRASGIILPRTHHKLCSCTIIQMSLMKVTWGVTLDCLEAWSVFFLSTSPSSSLYFLKFSKGGRRHTISHYSNSQNYMISSWLKNEEIRITAINRIEVLLDLFGNIVVSPHPRGPIPCHNVKCTILHIYA